MKKLFLLFVLMLLPLVVSADKSGKCGDNVYYTYNSTNHTLTIYGEGSIWSNFPSDSPHPWGVLDENDIQSVIIESGVTSISRWCFFEFENLTSITIPNSVTSIGSEAFYGCNNLTSITIPNSVNSIDNDAFLSCSKLASIVVENGNQHYDSRNNCNAIIETSTNTIIIGCNNTTIPNSVNSIGGGAFSGCSGLTSVTIPKGVTSIGGGAFSGCSGLTSIIVESGNQNYDSRNNCNAIIDSNNQLIVGCKNTIIPNSVSSIGSYAFSDCKGLVYITLPPNLTSIGNGAFDGCTGLVYVSLPSNLTFIGWSAFWNCNSLTDIYCKAVNVPSANSNTFFNPESVILHVPDESLNAYQTTEPWNIFKNYESLSSSDLQASEKCSKPTISIVDGKFVFNCETQFVDYHWSISTPYGNNGNGVSVPSSITLNVFATKSGYLPSDVATYEFSGLVGDVNNDGEVNVADHVKLSDIILNK